MSSRMPSGAPDQSELRISVLGPLRLQVDGVEVEVPGPKRRAVLAMLAMAAPDPVTVDQLVDAVWPEELPGSARAALHSHVSRLRRHLGPVASRLRSSSAGYRLELGPDELDVTRVSRFLDDARAFRAVGDPEGERRTLACALEQWRGVPLGELLSCRPLAAWSQALVQLQLDTADGLAARELDLGQASAAAAVASASLFTDPLRETSLALLVQALAASGRSAAALRTANEFRQRLRVETGLDPSAALADLERQIAG